MRFEFTTLPGSPSDIPRPTVEVSLDGPTDRLNLLALVDTGALYNRFGAWVADSLNIDLDGLPVTHIGLGGHTTAARTVIVRLTIGGYTWEAPVSFCEPWPFAFHLLGQEGFLRWFTVMINAADRTVDIHPIEQ